MPTHRDYIFAEGVDVNGKPYSFGSRSQPIETTVDGVVERKTGQLATATSLLIWNSAESITNFDKFYFVADQAVKLELTVDRGGEVGSEELVIVLPAGKPFVLPTDDALANYSGTLSGGTQDTVDEIYIRNESGSTANYEYLLVT